MHFAVTRAHLASIAPLPPDVIGVPFELDFVRTIEQAFRWHPDARHLVVVTGAALQDRDWETGLRDALSNWNPSVTREFLAGLPTDDVLRRVRDLDVSSIVFTPGYFEDGAGHAFVPVEAARAIATASGAPVYGTFEPFIGAGVVGGYMTSFQEMGRIAGAAVTAILDGAAPASVRLPDTVPARLQLDWRQIRRWGIDEADVPADAVVRFKAPNFWEQYRATALIAATVFALQAALIGGLLLERRRRRLAEAAVRDQGSNLRTRGAWPPWPNSPARSPTRSTSRSAPSSAMPKRPNSFSNPARIDGTTCGPFSRTSVATTCGPARSSAACVVCSRGTRLRRSGWI